MPAMNTVFIEKICRCCLNESDSLTNFADKVSGIGDGFVIDPNLTYLDAMYLCTNLRCDIDLYDANDQIIELPKTICDSCLNELRAALNFRAKCETSDNLLREQTLGHTTSTVWGDSLPEETVNFEQSADIGKSQLIEINTVSNAVSSPLKSCANQERNIETHEQTNELDSSKTVQIFPAAEFNQTSSKEVEIEALNKTATVEVKPNVDREKTHKCNGCSKSFYTKRGLSAHSIKHNKPAKNARPTCSICSRVFTTRQRLNLHMITHTGEKSFNCDDCDKTFSTESKLRCHRRTHTGERPFRCNVCDLTFAQANALKCHKRIHTGEKPYECKFCQKRFTQKTILKTHLTLHTGKTIKCPDCDKMFSRSSNLILHRREHTGEKPYVCSQCPNRYKQKSHLDRHMDTHLGVTYTCKVCGKGYAKPWSLKMHMFSHFGNKPYPCSVCEAEFIRKDKYKNHMNGVHGIQLDNSDFNSISQQSKADI